MSANAYLMDASTRHAVFLTRYAGGQSKKAQDLLGRMRREILGRLADEPTTFRHGRLNALLSEVDAISATYMTELSATVKTSMDNFVISEAEFTASMLDGAATVQFAVPSDQQLITAAEITSFDVGSEKLTVSQALDQFGRNKKKQIVQMISDGVVLGDTTQEISRNLRGTMTTLQNRQIDALVRTSVTHLSSVARETTYAENADIMEGYEWVATLDNRTTMICGSLDGKVFETGRGPMPPAHWNCVLGDTLITSALGVSAATKRIFEGEVITINTVAGNKLTVTPNHPVLTEAGWKAAHLVKVGEKCFNQICAKGVSGVDGKYDNSFELASDVFESFLSSRGVFSSEVEVSTPYFHGDGTNDEIAEIRATCDLSPVRDIGIVKDGRKTILNSGNHVSVNPSLKSLRSLALLIKGSLSSLCSKISGLYKSLALLGRRAIHPGLLLCASSSEFDSILFKDSLNGTWADAERIGDSSNSYAGGVFLDDIISVERSDFNGHVYNLQTSDHCYAANGIITHNCRSTTIPKIKKEFDLGADVTGKRPSKGSSGPKLVNARETYSGWLKRQSKEFQNEALGVERAKLFRSGQIDMKGFVDATGRTYTLNELKLTDNLSLN